MDGSNAFLPTTRRNQGWRLRPVQRWQPYRRGVKRVFDAVAAAGLLALFLPLIGLLWALVRMDGGPGFFAHQRIGRGGVAFGCLKLRSMVPDAGARLAAHLAADPAARAEWAATRKLAKDPRITRLGRFLRETSLDELPQLWNVLRGEMSLVGPRPVPADELTLYGPAAARYLSVRPGLTGLWQVSGRNGTGYAARIRLDEAYVASLSLPGDLTILWRTLGVVLRRTGL